MYFLSYDLAVFIVDCCEFVMNTSTSVTVCACLSVSAACNVCRSPLSPIDCDSDTSIGS